MMDMEQPLASAVQQLNINETGTSRPIEREQANSRKHTNFNHQRRPRKNFEARNGNSKAQSEELDYIPTAVVIKNIPFSVKRELLLDIFQQIGLPAPFALNYHLDNGVFRGLAFANFHTPEETSLVVSTLRGVELCGRKLRIEFKKTGGPERREDAAEPQAAGQSNKPREMPQEQTESGLDFDDLQTRVFYDQVASFYEDNSRAALIYPPTLDSVQRRLIHEIGERFGLYHYSTGVGAERHIRVSKTKPPITQAMASPKKPGTRRPVFSKGGAGESGPDMETSSRPFASKPFKRTQKASDLLAVYPIRQPLIPDLKNNFSARKDDVKPERETIDA
ncbi:Peptidyl-prolyl cis-trans isomerase pin4 [Entomophthora muscae]|uniref:Peptidyl-prolyl cis-trans isomerase pin4 n=1 Tax=Entomophthora muscae TaxID=34485 RepID=A0ACC2U5T7_9FUNG|nr:Peptidyl-prolyl cis-trans isomerase pin4 [Entomophthora muscae]